MESLRSAGPVVAVDAGDTLFHAVELPPAERSAAEARARLLLAGLARMKAPLAVGERELALGLPWLERAASEAGVPLLAANLVAGDGRRPFGDRRTVSAGGQRVGILAVVGAGTRPAGLTVEEPGTAARAAAEALRGDGATVIVALLHMPVTEARALLDGGLDADVAVVAHDGRRLEPEPVGAALLAAPGDRGKEACSLAFDPRRGEPWADVGAPRRAQQEVLAAERFIAIARGRLDRAATAADRKGIEDFMALQAERAEEARRRAREAPQGRLYDARVLPLGPEVPEDAALAPEVAAVLAKFGSPPEPAGGP